MPSRRFVVALLPFALACAGGGATADAPAETTADVRTAIEAANQAFMRHIAGGHADSVAAAYTEDGAFVLSHGPASNGKAAIAAAWGSILQADVRLQLTTLDVTAADSLAVERGSFDLLVRDKADTTKVLATDKGEYIVAWKKRDGVWKLHWDMATTTQPMPAPAPAPEAK